MNKQSPWGISSSIDIYNCNPDTIRDAGLIREFVIQLVKLIEMKSYGEPIICHFGEDERVAGYSLVQLIETSCITAHFANETNTTYLDIFSCKSYDVDIAAQFSCKYFNGSTFRVNSQKRF